MPGLNLLLESRWGAPGFLNSLPSYGQKDEEEWWYLKAVSNQTSKMYSLIFSSSHYLLYFNTKIYLKNSYEIRTFLFFPQQQHVYFILFLLLLNIFFIEVYENLARSTDRRPISASFYYHYS